MTSKYDCQAKLNELEKYSKPMPWIGVYIAVASLVCTLAMAADLFHGFRHRKFWFPCKYFTLNAASLTVIAISMKLLVDLSNPMPRSVDQLSKASGTIFMWTMLANFMPSLGPMSNTELLTNLIALGILVITIAVNLFLQISSNLVRGGVKFVLIVTFMLFLFVILLSLALTLPNSKRILDLKYREMHKRILDDYEESERFGKSVVDKLSQQVSKYWIMAETSSPQFMIASSSTCSACGAICLFYAIILIISSIYLCFYSTKPAWFNATHDESDYKWSMISIAVIQVVGVVVGTIPPVFRWFSSLTFKLSLKWSKNYLNVYVVEKRWTQRLVDWKHNRVPVNIGNRKCRRLVHNVRNIILNVLIGFQVIVVVVCKTIHLIPIFLVIMVVFTWHCCKWLKHNLLMGKLNSANSAMETDNSQQRVDTEPDLSPYVLQLQDDVELSNRTLRSISKAVSKLIHKAEETAESNNLMKLLEKSMGFQGVLEFDNDRVPPLQYDRELQASNCWSLVVVTLTSILMALPNIRSDILDPLSQGVSEGLCYVSLVEESLYTDMKDMGNIIKAASKVWFEVELYGKWMDNNLQETAHNGGTSKEILEFLGKKAKSIVNELENSRNRGLVLDDSDLQNINAANSMYRISYTILLDYQSKGYENDEMLFEKISVMIADILSACLSNLPRVITMKCHADAIEKREESVRDAAMIFGKTKGILESIFGRYDIPNLNPDQMAKIDGWRAAAKRQSLSRLVSSVNNESISWSTSAELENVTVQ